jgi:hypothetical protein
MGGIRTPETEVFIELSHNPVMCLECWGGAGGHSHDPLVLAKYPAVHSLDGIVARLDVDPR